MKRFFVRNLHKWHSMLLGASLLAGCSFIQDGHPHPPALADRDLTVTVRVLTDKDFDEQATQPGFPGRNAEAFAQVAPGACVVFLRASEIRPGMWSELGLTVNHEFAHCEGWAHRP